MKTKTKVHRVFRISFCYYGLVQLFVISLIIERTVQFRHGNNFSYRITKRLLSSHPYSPESPINFVDQTIASTSGAHDLIALPSDTLTYSASQLPFQQSINQNSYNSFDFIANTNFDPSYAQSQDLALYIPETDDVINNEYHGQGQSQSHYHEGVSAPIIPVTKVHKGVTVDAQHYENDSSNLAEESHRNQLRGVLVVTALGYLLLGAAYLRQSAHQHQRMEVCHGNPSPSLWFLNVRPPRLGRSSNGGSELEQNMLDMFYNIDDDDSSELSVGGFSPDMSHVSQMCPSNAFFYGMNLNHMKAVETVKDLLMKQPGPKQVYAMAKSMRQNSELNPRVWYEALMKTFNERPDMKGMAMPGPLDAFPDSFIPSKAMNNALTSGKNREERAARYSMRLKRRPKIQKGKEKRRSHSKKKKQHCARVDGSTGKDNGIENQLWYYREDLMLNSHHWYWHMTHPVMTKVHADRRGELFYYSHHGFLQRYNIERMCNDLPRVQALPIYPGAPLEPPYNTHLDDYNSGMPRTDRPPHTPLSDINHEANHEMPQTIPVERWLGTGLRFGTDISSGYLISRHGKKAYLSARDGIDIVGNTLEASDISLNPDLYSPIGFHNDGHVLIGLSVDPNYKHKLPPGPMSDTATAVRDPIFYPYHTNTDNLFESYKKTLKPYQRIGGDFPLLWNGIHLSDVRVHSSNHAGQNELKTFWNERKFELTAGLSFDRNVSNSDARKTFPVCVKHLDHEKFVYQFDVERLPCANTHSGLATVRIFIAPRFGENGRLWLKEQRRLFVPLDSFTTKLKIGRNVVKRQSVDSTLTIPWRKTLAQLQAEFGTNPEPSCGCGWPHHLLLPRGSSHGIFFDLFVMVTNGEEDMVKKLPSLKSEPHEPELVAENDEMCRSAHIYCGIRDKMYPDTRPMGYPFDRYPYQVPTTDSLWDKVANLFGHGYRHVSSIEEYVHGIPNMAVTQITIRHDDG